MTYHILGPKEKVTKGDIALRVPASPEEREGKWQDLEFAVANSYIGTLVENAQWDDRYDENIVWLRPADDEPEYRILEADEKTQEGDVILGWPRRNIQDQDPKEDNARATLIDGLAGEAVADCLTKLMWDNDYWPNYGYQIILRPNKSATKPADTIQVGDTVLYSDHGAHRYGIDGLFYGNRYTVKEVDSTDIRVINSNGNLVWEYRKNFTKA